MWNVAKPGRHCWAFASSSLSEVLGFYIGHSVSTTVLDFVIFLLPVNLFFQPDTQKNTRIALLCLFGLGLVYVFFLPAPLIQCPRAALTIWNISVNLCSIGRLIYSLTPTLNSFGDLSWNSPTPTGLAVLEINLAAVCAASPIFWPVLKETWGRIVVTYEVRVQVTSQDGKSIQEVEMAESPRAEIRQGFDRAQWDHDSNTFAETMRVDVEKIGGGNSSETTINVDMKGRSFLRS